MIRSLSCIYVLVGAVLTVAAGSDTPAPGPQNKEVNSRAQDTAQEPAPRAEQDQTHEVSNETIPQPKRIEYSYPLEGDDERRKSVQGLQQLTVDLLALHNIYKEAHWDLAGPLHLQHAFQMKFNSA